MDMLKLRDTSVPFLLKSSVTGFDKMEGLHCGGAGVVSKMKACCFDKGARPTRKRTLPLGNLCLFSDGRHCFRISVTLE